MNILTDNANCANRFLEGYTITWEETGVPRDKGIAQLARRILKASNLYSAAVDIEEGWNYLLIAESVDESQYDILIELARNNVPLPHGILCLAARGNRFHGFKGRRWDSPEGNLYLSAHFAPSRKIENYGPGFMVLAAVSVVEAIDKVPGLSGQAGIKWVNDILIDDAKVCGVLAHTVAEDELVTNAIIGIGLNVETAPDIEPTKFVPRVGSLAESASDPASCTRGRLFQLLIRSIYKSYLSLAGGNNRNLIREYRDRSLIIGRKVTIYEDSAEGNPEILSEGRVIDIGNDLELILEGVESPIKRGRLAFQ